MENPISLGEHAPKTGSELVGMVAGFVRQNLGVVVAAAAGLALIAALVPHVYAAAMDYRPVCAVGYYGTTIDIELQGWRAGYECRHAVETISGTYETTPQGTAICGRRWHNLNQTVFDTKPNAGFGVLACSLLGIKGKAA